MLKFTSPTRFFLKVKTVFFVNECGTRSSSLSAWLWKTVSSSVSLIDRPGIWELFSVEFFWNGNDFSGRKGTLLSNVSVFTQTWNRNVRSQTNECATNIISISFTNRNLNVGNNCRLWNFELLFRSLAVLVCVWNLFFSTLRVRIRLTHVSYGMKSIIRQKTSTVNTKTLLQKV